MQSVFSSARARFDSSAVCQSARHSRSVRLLAIAAFAGIAGMAPSANAANDSWATAPASNTFSGSDWTVGSTVPGTATGTIAAGDSLYFGNSNTTILNNDESQDFAPGGITFNAGASAFSISGNELDLSSSPLTNNSSVLQTLSAPILLNSTDTITTTSGGGNILLSGIISGGGGITTAGAGTLTLSGVQVLTQSNPYPSTFSGTNTFNSGRVVELNSGTALGYQSTNNIGSSAVLELRNNTNSEVYQFSTSFNGTGTLQKTGLGTIALGYSVFGSDNVNLGAGGVIDVEGGELVGSSSNEGNWGSNQASLYVAMGATFDGAEVPIIVDALNGAGILKAGYANASTTNNGNSTVTIGVANGSGTFNGTIQDSDDGGGTGTLSLLKEGTGTETLSGDNTFSGTTTVTGGSLVLTNNLALEDSVLNLPAAGSGASVSFSSSVTSTSIILGGFGGSTNFSLQRGGSPASLTLTGNANSVLTGALIGGTTLTKEGGGIQTLSGANTFSGGTTILEGGLYLDYSANTNGGNPIIPATSALTLGGTTGFLQTPLGQSYPILQVQGSSLGPVTQTFNGLTLNAAASSQISVRGIGGNIATVALGSITHSTGSSVVFNNLSDGATGSQGLITTTTLANSTTGILGGWATINNSAANSTSIQIPTNYATVSGGTIVPYTYTGSQTISNATGETAFAGGANQNFDFVLTSGTSEYQVANGTTTDVNSILVDYANAGRLKLDVGNISGAASTGILRFGVDGGLFVASASATHPNLGYNTTYNGFVTAGGPNNNTAGTLNFQLNNRLDIYTSIVDNGTGPVTVVYNNYSNQTSRIYTSNYYSGGTFINSGRFQLYTNQGFGTGPVTVGAMGQAYFSSNQSYSNNFFINGDAGENNILFDTPSAIRFSGNDTISGNITLLADSTIAGGGASNNVISGQISGNYDLQINQSENGSAQGGSVTLSNPNDNWSGNTLVQGGTLILAAAGALPIGTNLSLTNSATLIANAQPVGIALSVGSLNVNGLVDLNNNDLIVHSSSLSVVNNLLQAGYNAGAWNGSIGIISSAAANNTTHLTALGAIINDNGSGKPLYGTNGTIAPTFGGQTPVDGDVLVKYTYYGDANLDGKVDGSDYSRIDSSFETEQTSQTSISGWANGDFNYDGVVDGSDYTLMDNAFNTQGAQISALIAAPDAIATAQISGAGATSAVPEPATLGLLGIGVAGLLGRRRRHI